MASRKKSRIELANLPMPDPAPPLPPVSGLPPEGFAFQSPTEERRERELEEILNELGTDARVKVWHLIDGKPVYAGEVSAEGFSLDTVLDAFGGGDKRLNIMQGKHVMERVTVSLDPSIPPKNPRYKPPLPGQNPTPGFGAETMVNLMGAMAAQQTQNANMMSQMMGGIVTALTTVMAAQTKTDPVQQALAIAQALKPAAGQNGTSEALALLKEGMAIAERLGPREDDGVMTAVNQGLGMLGTIVNGIVEERKQRAALASTRALPGSVGATDATAPGDGASGGRGVSDSVGVGMAGDAMTPPAISVRPWVDKARPFVGQLAMAARFMPATAAADTIQSHLSDEEFEDFVNDVEDTTAPGFANRLVAYFPGQLDGVNPEWIGAVITALLTSVDDEDDAAMGPHGSPPPNDATAHG